MLYVQYAQSTNFQNLLYGENTVDTQYPGLNNYLNVYWQDFYDQIFNILTCNSVGLNIWGQILNTGRQYYIGTQNQTFGFNVNPGNTTDYAQNFNNGSFTVGGTYTILNDGDYRCLLMLRARYFVCNGSILAITKLLNDFFINLQLYGSTDDQDYNIIVTVSPDVSTPYQVNYHFKHTVTPGSELPLWIAAIFTPNSAVNNNAYYLPIPTGGFPNITIT